MSDQRLPGGAGLAAHPDLATEFFALAHAVKRLANARYQGAGLSVARLMVLHELVDRGPTRIGELSDCTNVAARTMTSTVEGLARDGLVERRADPADRRAVVVAVTEHGREVFEDGVEIRNGVVDEVFAVLDDEERARLSDMLRRLAAAAGTVEAADRSHHRPG
jgi:DNA-binding MarR family transcriptional regulator